MKTKETINLPKCCPWMSGLDDVALQRLQGELQLRVFDAGSVVCRGGEPTHHWIGVFSGLLYAQHDGERWLPGGGAVAPGGWLGDQALLRRDPWAADVVALRRSQIGLLPAETYVWLRERSLGFGHLLLGRLEQQVRKCRQYMQAGRIGGADERVAQTLLTLFDPVLHPAVGMTLRITQEELAEICRLSRQRVNQALQRLVSLGLLRLRYGGVELLSTQGLEEFAARLPAHAQSSAHAEPAPSERQAQGAAV